MTFPASLSSARRVSRPEPTLKPRKLGKMEKIIAPVRRMRPPDWTYAHVPRCGFSTHHHIRPIPQSPLQLPDLIQYSLVATRQNVNPFATRNKANRVIRARGGLFLEIPRCGHLYRRTTALGHRSTLLHQQSISPRPSLRIEMVCGCQPTSQVRPLPS